VDKQKNVNPESNLFNLFIQTNSPGELTSWVAPIVKTFKHLVPASKITILLTPCQYASGQEKAVAEAIDGVDEVFKPKGTIKKIFSLPWFKKINSKGAFLYLGGDPMYSQIFSLKYRLPCFAYTEHNKKPGFLFKKVFYKSIDGDLMAERINQLQIDKSVIIKKYNLDPNNEYCLFFCGSRKQHFINLLPFIASVVKIIKEKKTDFQPIVLVSPYISDDDLDSMKKTIDLSKVILLRGDSLELMSISKLLICLPGTSTAEAMYLNLPMLVLIPLNRPDLIILDGVAGLIGNIPVLGTMIKKFLLFLLKLKKRLYALPNMLAKKEIVPEIAGVLEEDKIAELIIDYFYSDQKLEKMRSELALIERPQNIAENICKSLIV
jgi:hypothetical protein